MVGTSYLWRGLGEEYFRGLPLRAIQAKNQQTITILTRESDSLWISTYLLSMTLRAIRKILVRVLSQTDLPIKNLHEANDGSEALKILEDNDVSLVLSDINMPNVDGIELLTRIRASPKWKQLSVVMITTEGSQAKVMEAVQLGAKGYVRKPFTAEQIKEKVLSCLKAAEE